MASLDNLYSEWVEFADPTFGFMPARRQGVIEHLVEEVHELHDAVCMDDIDELSSEEVNSRPLTDHALEEAADVFVLLCHLTSNQKEQFYGAIRKKIDKNKARTWQPANENGVIRHVKGILD